MTKCISNLKDSITPNRSLTERKKNSNPILMQAGHLTFRCLVIMKYFSFIMKTCIFVMYFCLVPYIVCTWNEGYKNDKNSCT